MDLRRGSHPGNGLVAKEVKIVFNNAARTLPDRLSESCPEINQLLKDGWVPYRSDGTKYVVQFRMGAWEMDGVLVVEILRK